MVGKRGREILEKRKRALVEQLLQLDAGAEQLNKQIKQAPIEVIRVHGKLWKVSTANERLHRDLEDTERSKSRILQELHDVDLLIAPPKGRPKGRLNSKRKPVDPTIAKALAYRETPEGKLFTGWQFADKFSGEKLRRDKKKWMYRFNKACAGRPRSQ